MPRGFLESRILKKFNQKNFKGTGLSIGIAAFVRHHEKSWNEDIVDLVSRADKALYKAKIQGKNRVVLDDLLGDRSKVGQRTLTP